LCLFRQGRLDEAEGIYTDVIEKRSEHYPEILVLARTARDIIQKNRRTLQQALSETKKSSPPAETDGEPL
jgi:hypothetical protein